MSERSVVEGNFLLGLVLCFVVNILVLFCFLFLSGFVPAGGYVAQLIGLGQFVGILPVIKLLKIKGHERTIQGLLVGAAMCFLLNSACMLLTIFDL